MDGPTNITVTQLTLLRASRPVPTTSGNPLLVQTVVSGGGTIRGPGVACPLHCNWYLPGGRYVSLVAVPSRRHRFVRWAGFCAGRRRTCRLRVNVNEYAAGLGIFFKVDPSAAPCLDGRDASFTGAPVFPHYAYRQFVQDIGSTDTAGYSGPPGAEVRYSYQVDDLKGQRLVLRATMVSVNRDGSIRSADTSVIDNNDLLVEDAFTPGQCSQAGGGTFFAHMPINASGRYRIILELFIGMGLKRRVALGQTPEFTA